MNQAEDSVRLQEIIYEISVLIQQGSIEDATTKAKEAVAFATTAFGPEHINTTAAYSTLAACFQKSDQYEDAVDLLERALSILQGQNEDCDLHIAQVRNNLSVVYRHLLKPRTALVHGFEALKIRYKLLGAEHMETSVTTANIGFIFSWMGLIDLSLACYLLAYNHNPGNLAAKRNFESLIKSVSEDKRFDFAEILPGKATLSYDDLYSHCQRLLERDLSEDLYHLAEGQPAHPESYRNYVYQLKSALIRLFADGQNADDLQRSIVQAAKEKVRRNTRLPLYSGKMLLKRIERSNLQALGKAVLSNAFPAFDPKMQDLKKDLCIAKKSKTFNDLKMERLEGTGVTYTFSDKQYRRYAGDNNLPPSCYHSVCSKGDGDDDQTLCKELFEYTDPDIPGFVWVGDSWDEELMQAISALHKQGEAYRPGIYVFMLAPLDKEEQRLYSQFYASIFELQGTPEGLSILHIPVEASLVEVTNIVDLRTQATQEWFRNFFGKGDGAVFVKDAKQLPQHFTDMLPALTFPEYGGSGVTKSVGTWMRLAGVDGLVYPSARADVNIAYEGDNHIEKYRGWNFVDYSNTQFVADRETHADLHDWYGFTAGRQSAPKLVSKDTSWRIDGAEERYQVLRRNFIDLILQLGKQNQDSQATAVS